MPQPTKYDVIVIGTSQGGRFLPIEFAKAGRRVAVIERGPVGGVCVNFGCTPTKTMAQARFRSTCTLCENANKTWSRVLATISRAFLQQCERSTSIY